MKTFRKFLKEDWWEDLGQEGQEAYIKAHPNSSKAKQAKSSKHDEVADYNIDMIQSQNPGMSKRDAIEAYRQQTHSDYLKKDWELSTDDKERLSNQKATPEELEKWSDNKDKYVRMDVASDSKTPEKVLLKLSKDSSPSVRMFLAGWQSNLSKEVLNNLVNDPSKNVRQSLAYNRHTPIEILQKLTQDQSPVVRETAKGRLEARKKEK